ncbi:MAG: SCP2 sterol-binding domain-containing protein [bacterium]
MSGDSETLHLPLPPHTISPAALFSEWVPWHKEALAKVLRVCAPRIYGHLCFVVSGSEAGNRTLSWDGEELSSSEGFRYDAAVTFIFSADMFRQALKALREVCRKDELYFSPEKLSGLADRVSAAFRKLEETGGVMRLEINDPQEPLLFDVKLGGLLGFEPDVVISMERCDLAALKEGRATPAGLAEKERIKVKGDPQLFLQIALIFLQEE